MKKLKLYAMSMLAVGALFTACDDDDDDNNSTTVVTDEILVNENITSDITWTNAKPYLLSGKIYVEEGATLTIEAGAVIKAEGGKEANASALIVRRGGKLMAMGTSDAPIIFTSVLDEIQPGEITSPNLDASFSGLWGGLVILGKAPISADAAEVQTEGIPVSEDALYGGTDATDNSGTIQYVSVRHGGTLLGEGNEINGITLGGVGSGTTISNVEVVANLDDALEWFGGTVNVTNALVWAQGDDAYDIDQSYAGTVDNFAFKGNADSDHGLEMDGPEGTLEAGATFVNGSFIGYNEGYDPVDGWNGNFGEYADFRDGARGSYTNLYFTNFSENSDFELDDDATANNYNNGDLVFGSIEFNVSHLQAGNTDLVNIMTDKSSVGVWDSGIPTGEGKVLGDGEAPTVGADLTVFSGWTLGSATGEL